MNSPTQCIHKVIGQPEPTKNKGLRPSEGDELCLVCGFGYSHVMPAKNTISRTDTDLDKFKAPWSEVVCSACAWCSEGRPPDTLRMWSILYREDGQIDNPGLFRDYITQKAEKADKTYSVQALLEAENRVCLANRADLSPYVITMLDPPDCPWACCFADSGQIHLVRFATLNQGDHYSVIFERDEIRTSAAEFGLVLWNVASLRSAGFHTEDIRTGVPHPRSLREQPLVWFTHNTGTMRARSDLLALCLFLCTKDWTDEYRRLAEASLPGDRRDDALERGRRSLERMPGLHPPEEQGPEEVLGPRPEEPATRLTQGTLF